MFSHRVRPSTISTTTTVVGEKRRKHEGHNYWKKKTSPFGSYMSFEKKPFCILLLSFSGYPQRISKLLPTIRSLSLSLGLMAWHTRKSLPVENPKVWTRMTYVFVRVCVWWFHFIGWSCVFSMWFELYCIVTGILWCFGIPVNGTSASNAYTHTPPHMDGSIDMTPRFSFGFETDRLGG
jgi:hypothetical protein